MILLYGLGDMQGSDPLSPIRHVVMLRRVDPS
jgi:hypothetical protein